MAKTALISGGAGFIGANAAWYYRRQGWRVSLFDDLSRKGTQENLQWLMARGSFQFVRGDVRDRAQVEAWFRSNSRASLVLHLAAQVAVTTSIQDPRTDFEINALGTFNLLESARRLKKKPFFIYASTNKVYGGMEGVGIRLRGGRYAYVGLSTGVPESQPLDFHTPYGCSKGSGDQYVRDFGRIFGLPTAVLRQSCVYGHLQRGNEDQGWVAHFLSSAQKGRTITLYGDGRQVRDVLFVEDLLEAIDLCFQRRAATVLNIGGGPENTLSLLELLRWMRRRGVRPRVRRDDWRSGDQRVYISDIRKARKLLGWRPRVAVDEGLGRLWNWLETGEARELSPGPPR